MSSADAISHFVSAIMYLQNNNNKNNNSNNKQAQLDYKTNNAFEETNHKDFAREEE